MDGWFPRLNSRGSFASGSGTIWVDEMSVYSPGLYPQWLDDETLVFKGTDDKPRSLNLPSRVVTVLSQTPTRQVTAGAGKWHAAVSGEIGVSMDYVSGTLAKCVEHGGSNFDRSIFFGTRALVEHKPVQDPRAANNRVAWILWTGQNAIDREPWGWDGVTISKLRVYTQSWEGHPVPFLTPEGPWLLSQTNWDLRLRPWGSKTGYIIATGENKNLNPDVRFIDNLITVVCNDSAGKYYRFPIPLSQARVDVSVPHTQPPPPEQPMYRNYKSYFTKRWNELGCPAKIKALGDAGVTDEEKYKQIQCPALVQIASELYWAQGHKDVGLSIKNGGNRWKLADGRSVATDIFAIRPTNSAGEVIEAEKEKFHVVDVVMNGGTKKAAPGWLDHGENNDPNRPWAAPPKTDAPTPDPTTHKYVGGGNDTGTCDECDLSRFNVIHAIPESKVPHIYDGGEQDTGLCDICQKPHEDSIHTGNPPPEDCQEWIDEVTRLTAENDRLTAQVETLLAEVDRLLAENERLRDELEQAQKPCECVISGSPTIIRIFGITCKPK